MLQLSASDAVDLRARIPSLPLTLTASGVVIDSLGRRWTASKHPRDRKGRFIETFGEVRAFMKGKGYTKPDFNGRVISMDPDGTGVVQVTGGRGEYAKMIGRLVKVPLDRLENAEYKARIGQTPRPANDVERQEIDGFIARMREKGRDIPGFTDSNDVGTQLQEIENLAEIAEDSGDTEARDSLLDIKSSLRGEPSAEETEAEVKAILGVDQTAPAPEPDETIPAPPQTPDETKVEPPEPEQTRVDIPEGWTDTTDPARAERDGYAREVQPPDPDDPSVKQDTDGNWYTNPLDPTRFPTPQEALDDYKARLDADRADADAKKQADADAREADRQANNEANRQAADQRTPYAEALKIAQDAGAGEAVLEAIKTGDRAKIDSALRDDPTLGERYRDWETRDDVDAPTPAQRAKWDADGEIFDPVLRSEPAPPETKAELPTPQEAPDAGSPTGQPDAESPGPVQPTSVPATPVPGPEDGGEPGGLPGARPDGTGRPGPAQVPEPDEEEGLPTPERPREPRPAVAKLKPPTTQLGAWAMLFGLQWDGMVAPRNDRLFNAGSRRKHRKQMALRAEIRAVISEMKLDDTRVNAISVRPLNSNGDRFEVESGVLPDAAGKELVPSNSPVGDLAAEAGRLLGELPDSTDPELIDAVQKLHLDLMTGDIDAARDGFEADIAHHPFLADRPATVQMFRDSLRDFTEPGAEPTLARIGTPPKPSEFEGWDEVDPSEWAHAVWDRDSGVLYGHLLPEDDDDRRQAMIRQIQHFVRLHNGDIPLRVLRNKDSEQEIVLQTPASPELLAAMVKSHEEMHAFDPMFGEKVSVLLDFGESNFTQALEYKGVHGETMIGGRAMRFDVNKLQKALDKPRRQDGAWMPAAYGDDAFLRVKYVVAHEWGHMRSHSGNLAYTQRDQMLKAFEEAGDPAPSKQEIRLMFEKKGRIPYRWSDWYGYDDRGKLLKGYEAYAEHFAEWVTSGGKTTDKRTIAFAKEFGLDKAPLDAPGGDGDDRVPDDIANSPQLGPEEQLWDELNNALFQDDPHAVVVAWTNWIIDRFADDPALQDAVSKALEVALNDKRPDRVQYRAGLYGRVLGAIPDHDVRDTMNAVFSKVDVPYNDAARRWNDRIDAIRKLLPDDHVHYARVSQVIGDMFPTRGMQESAAAVLKDLGLRKDTAMYLFPTAELSSEYLDYVASLLDLEEFLYAVDPGWRNPENVVAADGKLPDADAINQNYYRDALWLKHTNGFDVTEGVDMFNAIYPAARIEDISGKPSPAKDIPAPEPTPPAPPAPPAPPGGGGGSSDKFPTKIKNLAEEFFRGRSKGAKRGVGNIHLAERIAYGKDGVPLRKNDVVWFPAAGGNQKRPAADGYIVNMGIAQDKIPQVDADGNPILDAKGKQVVINRPKLDEAGNPIVNKIVVRHFDPAYIGDVHAWDKERKAKQAWPFPYWDYTIDGKKLELVPDENPRAQHIIEEFGLHGRRMAGRGAGRIAPIIGKVFRLERMRNAVPIQNRFLRDKNNKLIGEGDIVRYEDELYEVIRPNNPWDNNGVPRVQIFPVGGGEGRQVGAHRVEYVDDAQNLLFFRGVGGIAAPQLQDVKDLVSRLGISDADLNDAIAKKDFVAVAKRLSRMPEVAAFLDAEGTRRKQIRDRIEIDNGGRAAPIGHVEVSEFEYLQAQKEKGDAVILHAAKNGFFADEDGNPPDIPEQVQKDLFGDYVGDEADIAMRSKYIDLYEKVDADAAVVPEGDKAAKDAYALVQSQKKVNLAVVGSAHLPDPVQRAKAQAALEWLASKYREDADRDGVAKVAELRLAIERWGTEFDARNRGGAPVAPAPAPPAPAPAPAPAVPGVPVIPGVKPRVDVHLDPIDFKDTKELVNAVNDIRKHHKVPEERAIVKAWDALLQAHRDGKVGDLQVIADALRDEINVKRGAGFENYADDMDNLLDKFMEFNVPKAAPVRGGKEAWSKVIDALKNAGRPKDKFDQDELDYISVLERDLPVRFKGFKEIAAAINGGKALSPALEKRIENLREAIKEAGDHNRGTKGVHGLERVFDRFGEIIDTWDAKRKVPAGPAISDEDLRFATVRGRVNGKNHKALHDVAAGIEPNREQLDGAIADLDVMIARYDRRPEKAEQAQRVKDALVAVRDAMDARDAVPVEPVGRTDAVQNVFDRIAERVRELVSGKKRAEARKLEGRADDIAEYFDKAQEAHEADDKEARDRWLKDIDLALDGMAADGHKDLADELRRQVAGNRARFEADDNRAEPMDRSEGADRVDAAVADIGLDVLRRGGPEGRKKAKEIREKIDAFEDAVDAADAEQDKDARDAIFDQAQEAAETLRPEYPDLAEVMDAVLAGQRARKDAAATTADDLTGHVGDPSHVDEVNGDSPAANFMREVEGMLEGVDIAAYADKRRIKHLSPPAGFKEAIWRGGSLNGILFLTLDDDRKIALKVDGELRGAQAEENVARLYRDLGLPQPMVRPLKGDRGVVTGRAFLMQMSGDVDPSAINAVGHERKPDWAKMGAETRKEAFFASIANAIMGQSDRHGGNLMHVKTPNGERPIIIDNGLMMFHSAFGRFFKPDDPNTWTNSGTTPNRFISSGVGGNYNVFHPMGKSYVADNPNTARDEMVEFAERMRERAKVVRLTDQEHADFIVTRAQWVIDNADAMMKAYTT